MAGPTAPLAWHVFQSEPAPTLAGEPAPGQRHRIWPPASSTLISGASDAVLVDAPITVAQATGLADQVAATGKTVRTISVTHGHCGHWLSLSVLLDRFTSARAVALPAVVEQMRQHSTPKELDLWHWHQPRRPTLATGGGERSRPGMTMAGTQPPPGVQDHDGKDGAKTRW